MSIERKRELMENRIDKSNTVPMKTAHHGLDEIHAVYFIGIGGIGMSALARFFQLTGKRVSGYDRVETGLTKELESSGIPVHYTEDIEQVPKDVQLVIYTPAVPADHRELLFYRENGYKVVKRSDVLQMITASSFNICVAGTHGKTTITTMIAHVLRDSGYGCTAFLGGIAVNYNSNFWLQDVSAKAKQNICVVEADEYDRSFLKLEPDVAVISAMDPDHLDIYGTAESMEQAFVEFGQKVRPGGLLVSKFGLKRNRELKKERQLIYSLQNEAADVYASNIKMENGSYEFDVNINEDCIEQISLNMGGMHNIENAVAAIAVANSLEIETGKIRAAIGSFRGVKRRFEYIVRNERIVFIDDYAHHPEELKALINGAKSLFRQRKCSIIFQPHLYSRTKDLAAGFAQALDLADQVVLLPIYPARELPIEGVQSEMILEQMQLRAKTVKTKTELIDWVQNSYSKEVNREFGEVLITAGAGDIDMLVQPIKEIIKTI